MISFLGMVGSARRLSPPATPVTRKYSVRFLRLQVNRREPVRTASKAGTANAGLRAAQIPGQSAARNTEEPSKEFRAFELPRTVRANPVKQTLVQLDRPPNLPLKQDISLPAMLLWTDAPTPPEMRKQFVPPSVRKLQRIARSLPVAPTIELGNREQTVADLKIASNIPTEAPRLVQPTSTTAPVRIPGPQAVKIPNIVPPDIAQPSEAAIISIPDSAVRFSELTVLPPANQIAPPKPAASAGSGGTADGGELRGGAHGSTGAAEMPATGGSGGQRDAGMRAGNASGTTAVAEAGAGTSAEGRATGIDMGGGGDAGMSAVPGTTRLVLPKEGKFGVVITGAASSAPYSESIGVLTGKVVYTVYLRVGLHKNWILQYCLPNGAGQQVRRRGSATPIQAPWPFLMLRPDALATGNADYVILHGNISAEGHFEGLGLVFPNELEQKDLLLRSLKHWEFRPASRDGVPTTVEFLLIIPNETD